MRKIKKLVATLLAATMVMAMGVLRTLFLRI